MAMTRPNTIEILEGIKHNLIEGVLPEVQSDFQRLQVEMMGDLLSLVQRRIENEPQWLLEEADITLDLLSRAREALAGQEHPAVAEALKAIERVQTAGEPGRYEAVSSAYLLARYSDVSAALEAVIRALGLVENPESVDDLVKEIQRFLIQRNDRELVIVGPEPIRGRG
jgi:hypothetical protein